MTWVTWWQQEEYLDGELLLSVKMMIFLEYCMRCLHFFYAMLFSCALAAWFSSLIVDLSLDIMILLLWRVL